MQRGNHAVCDHPCPEPARRSTVDPAVENQLHLAGPADVEVFTNDFFEEYTARDGTVQYLCQRELRLQDGNLVAVPRFGVASAAGIRQQSQPRPQYRPDLLRTEPGTL